MKAAVFYGARDFRIENIEDPKIESSDVLVKVKVCGICGSDLHAYKQGIFSRPGFVMGHEIAGEVVEVGNEVNGINMGDRVIPMVVGANVLNPGCGECFWCRRGQPQWCSANAHKPCGECDNCKSGQFWMCEKLQRHLPIGYSRNGGYAEYIVVPDAVLNGNVFNIPDNISWEEAVFTEPLWGAYRWVMQAEPQSYDTGVVTGLGTIGLLVMEVLKNYVSRVIVSEVSPKRLQLAVKLGADVAIDATKDDPLARVIELTDTGRSFGGKGGGCADIVMECSGVPVALQQALEMTRAGGHIVLVGLFEEDVPLNINRIILKQFKLVSSYSWTNKPVTQEIMESMDLLAQGKVNVKPLISHEFPLDNIMEAFEVQTKPDQSVKVIIKP
ncbi:zinc-binding dehydrogenase [Chloroflexota bacterium]